MHQSAVRLQRKKQNKLHRAHSTATLATTQNEHTDPVGDSLSSDYSHINANPYATDALFDLQRTIGNRAVQRLFDARHSGMIQRCNGDEYCSCTSCTAKHSATVALQSEEIAQRAMGDGHDLTAAPIAGDVRLEDAYDGVTSKYLRSGSKGEPVLKVQSALLQLGFKLPKHGPDGDFGGETVKAVKEFQTSKTIDHDGIVGKDTLDELNKALDGSGPAPTPIGPKPPPGASDFKIDHIGTSTQQKLFFGRDSAVLTSDATTEIGKIKTAAPASVNLIGFASAEESPSLADARAKAVEAALVAAPQSVTVTSAIGNAAATEKSADFTKARSVEVLIGSAKPTTLDCKAKIPSGPDAGKPVNPPTQPCPTMDADTWTAFNNALPISQDSMKRAVDAADPANAAYNADLVKKFFGNDSAATIAALKLNLGNLKLHVENLAARTQCGGQCDTGGCENGPIAYNSGVDAASTMTLCVPTFKGLNVNDAARNLIHESAHGTSPLGGGPDKGTADLAYRHERLIFQLSPQERLRNSDSYALFALFARETQIKSDPNAVPSGIQTPSNDSLVGFTDANEQDAIKAAVAQLEKRLTWCSDHVGQMYGEVVAVKNGKKAWSQSWAEDMMRQAADRFSVTRPPKKPTLDDQATVAALTDRYKHMSKAVKRDLKITRVAAGLVTWADDGVLAADHFDVGPDFFKANADNQISILLESMAKATADVESAFVPSYVSFARWIHENA